MLHASASTYHSNDLCHLIDESIHKTGKNRSKAREDLHTKKSL